MIVRDGRICRVDGEVTLDTVPRILETIRPMIDDGVDTIDCTAVHTLDSTALAMLFSCQRHAQANNRLFAVVGLPTSLHSLAELYGVADLLPGMIAANS